MTLVEAIWKVEEIETMCRRGEVIVGKGDAEAISMVLRELRAATDCPSCDGRGRRWYSFIGEATFEACRGSGKRR